MAILVLGETEDMMSVLAPALYPIFGILTTLRYPTQPLRTVPQGHKSQNLMTFVKDWPTNTLEQNITSQMSVFPPMAYTVLKMPVDLRENTMLLKRDRSKAIVPLQKEIHPVNWRQDIFHPLHGMNADFPEDAKTHIKNLLSPLCRYTRSPPGTSGHP